MNEVRNEETFFAFGSKNALVCLSVLGRCVLSQSRPFFDSILEEDLSVMHTSLNPNSPNRTDNQVAKHCAVMPCNMLFAVEVSVTQACF